MAERSGSTAEMRDITMLAYHNHRTGTETASFLQSFGHNSGSTYKIIYRIWIE